MWRSRQDLNLRPPDYKAGAPPTEPREQKKEKGGGEEKGLGEKRRKTLVLLFRRSTYAQNQKGNCIIGQKEKARGENLAFSVFMKYKLIVAKKRGDAARSNSTPQSHARGSSPTDKLKQKQFKQGNYNKGTHACVTPERLAPARGK